VSVPERWVRARFRFDEARQTIHGINKKATGVEKAAVAGSAQD
jgi:hypothetical protein